MRVAAKPRISRCPEGQRFDIGRSGRLKPVHTPNLGTRCNCAGCRARRIWTPERRFDVSERMRRRIAAGLLRPGRRKDGRPRKRPPDAWMPDHDRLLDALLGHADIATIAAILTDRFWIERSETAVGSRIKLRGLSLLAVRPWSRHDLTRVLGACDEAVVGWIERGWLVGVWWRLGGGQRANAINPAFPRAVVERFLRAHPHVVRPERVRDPGLRTLVVGLQRGRRWLGMAEAARAIGRKVDTVVYWRKAGRIPSARLVGRRWRIPATDLPLLRAMPDLRGKHPRGGGLPGADGGPGRSVGEAS